MWGQAVNVPLSTVPVIFGQPACTLVIQINGDGFDTFLNDKHIARLEHRRELASGRNSLFLNFPATDDYNKVRILVCSSCFSLLFASTLLTPPSLSKSFLAGKLVGLQGKLHNMPQVLCLPARYHSRKMHSLLSTYRYGGETNLPWQRETCRQLQVTRVSILCTR